MENRLIVVSRSNHQANIWHNKTAETQRDDVVVEVFLIGYATWFSGTKGNIQLNVMCLHFIINCSWFVFFTLNYFVLLLKGFSEGFHGLVCNGMVNGSNPYFERGLFLMDFS